MGYYKDGEYVATPQDFGPDYFNKIKCAHVCRQKAKDVQAGEMTALQALRYLFTEFPMLKHFSRRKHEKTHPLDALIKLSGSSSTKRRRHRHS